MKKSIQLILSICFLISFNTACYAVAGMEVDANVRITDNPARFAKLIKYMNVQPLAKGYIDVTKGPYFAKGDGVTDDTQAIQNAIDDAYEGNFVAFFPGDKVYLVSNQLKCIKDRKDASRKFAYQLVGSSKGKTPVIRLKDDCKALNGQILVFYDALFPSKNGKISQPARHYGSIFRGIDIDMGDNAEVDALTMSGAQLCSIEDVKIYGKRFNSGIHDLPGSGGFTVNVSVDGGKYGIWQDSFRPNPTINGLTLTNQTQAGVFITDSRGPVIITGFKIVSPVYPSGSYNAIFTKNDATNASNQHAGLCLTDGSIEMLGTTNSTAIYNNNQSVTLYNVFVKSYTIISSAKPARLLAGSATQWNKVSNYIFTSKSDAGTVNTDFVKLNNQTDSYQFNEPLIMVNQPETDLLFKHVWATMPSWEDSNLVDITNYGATPENINDTDDDGIAIQKAIDDVSNPKSSNYGKTVFIPRGHYHVLFGLNFKSGLKIIGASKTISAIQGLKDRNWDGKPMIQSADDPNGSLVMSDFAIVPYPHVSLFNIRTNNTILRDIATELITEAKRGGKNSKTTWSNSPSVALLSFTGNAGAKVYGISVDQLSSTAGLEGDKRIPGFHFVDVCSTVNPISFYQFSIEHMDNSPQVMFNNAKNVSIFGFKYEGDKEVLNVINSDKVKVIGGSGNYSLEDNPDTRAIVVVKNSTNILLQNLVRKSEKQSNSSKHWILSDKDAVSYDFGILSYKIGNF